MSSTVQRFAPRFAVPRLSKNAPIKTAYGVFRVPSCDQSLPIHAAHRSSPLFGLARLGV
jgi:hypothetical protein